MTQITLIEHSGNELRNLYARFVAHDGEKSCEFSTWNGSPVLTSWGGHAWPGSFRDLFAHFGDEGAINCRSGYRLTDNGREQVREALSRVIDVKTE